MTFFPQDGEKLTAVARIEGLTKQEWLARTIDEAIERTLARLLDQAIRDFGPICLWNVALDQPRSALLPAVVQGLRKYGGLPGWRLAADIAALAGPERSAWR